MPAKMKYDWEEIQKYYDLGYSLCECQEKFGFSNSARQKSVKTGRLRTRNFSEAQKNAHKRNRKTKPIFSEKARESLSIAAKKRGIGGHRNSHRIKYKGVWLDSTYELEVARILDEAKIKWIRPTIRFLWIDQNSKERRYKPDFYLPEHNMYLDPKNDYLVKQDERKIRQVMKRHGIKVWVMQKKDIEAFSKGPLVKLGSRRSCTA